MDRRNRFVPVWLGSTLLGIGRRSTLLQQVSLSRKLIHLAMTVVPVLGWLVSHRLALGLAGMCVTASLAAEVTRRRCPQVNEFFWQLLPTTFRRGEERRVLGSTWLSVGMMASLLLLGQDVGGTAALFLIWGDPMAEFVGRTWGRSQQRKTWAGSLGCLGACLLAGAVVIGWRGMDLWPALVGAVVATFVERWSPPPDDNLWIPILSGLAIVIMEWLIGGQTVLFGM
jgi:dolichol kinase